MPAVTLGSNLAALNAERRLGESTAGLRRTFDRLSSGLRINRAVDDAAGLSVSASLTADARVFTQAIRNVNDGLGYLTVATGAAAELKGILFRLRELSTQSSNGVYTNAQRRPLEGEAQALIEEYNRIVSGTRFNGRSIFDPSSADLVVQAGYGQLVASLGISSYSATNDGTFQGAVSYTSDSEPIDLAIADFNRDGRLDVLASNSGANTLTVSLGNGDGTFSAPLVADSGPNILKVAAADFNGDGNLDIVSAIGNRDWVNVLLGNGNGTFGPRVSYNTGWGPGSVVTFDANGDGNTDIMASNGDLSVLLGNGDGTFAPFTEYPIGSDVRSMAHADINRDGNEDVITASYFGGAVTVVLGNGDGTFQAPVEYYAPGAFDVAAGDINHDGHLDLVAVLYGSDDVAILLGRGDGTFDDYTSIPAGVDPRSIKLADLNGDGRLDIITAEEADDTISIYCGNGDGTFNSRTTLPLAGEGWDGEIADVSGDGLTDLVATERGNSTFGVFLGNGVITSVNIGLRAIDDVSVATAAAALDAQARIDGYLATVNTVTGIIGAAASRFESAVSSLQALRENYTNAAGRITDADVAEESSQLVRSGILQRAGAAVLAQASREPALALRLLDVEPR